MYEKLIGILKEYSPDIAITPKTNLQTDLQLNSFDMIQLIVSIEDAFDITVPERKIQDFHIVSDILNYLEVNS